MDFDLETVQMEFREFSVDNDVAELCGSSDALSFCLHVKSVVSVPNMSIFLL